ETDTDSTPAQYAWTVDVSKPDTVIESGPGAITGPEVTFSFTGTLAESFECKLAPIDEAFLPCSSPVVYPDLAQLPSSGYEFFVRAVTADDLRDDTPAQQAFVVDATGPVLDAVSGSPQAGATTNTRANLAFSVFPSEPGVTFACRFNAAAT